MTTRTISNGAIWIIAMRLAPAAIAAKNTKASPTPSSNPPCRRAMRPGNAVAAVTTRIVMTA